MDRSVGSKEPEITGWILYDAGCGFCTQSIALVCTMLRRRGLGVMPLQTAWANGLLGQRSGTHYADVRLLLASGECICGADVYRHALRRVWWTYPLFLLSGMPLVRPLFDNLYRIIADHRYDLSRCCSLRWGRAQTSDRVIGSRSAS